MRCRRYVCGVSPPRDEVPSLCSGQALLFRQKDPKPFPPVRGPTGPFAPVPNIRAAELASLGQSSPTDNDSALGRSRAQGGIGTVTRILLLSAISVKGVALFFLHKIFSRAGGLVFRHQVVFAIMRFLSALKNF